MTDKNKEPIGFDLAATFVSESGPLDLGFRVEGLGLRNESFVVGGDEESSGSGL